jgi:hypothetical protein
MKKIAILSITFLFLITFDNISGQKSENAKKECFYWFNISIKTVIDDELKRPVIRVNKIYKNMNSGSFTEFAESFKKNLNKNKLCVDPFSTKEIAKETQQCYDIGKLNLYRNTEFY